MKSQGRRGEKDNRKPLIIYLAITIPLSWLFSALVIFDVLNINLAYIALLPFITAAVFIRFYHHESLTSVGFIFKELRYLLFAVLFPLSVIGIVITVNLLLGVADWNPQTYSKQISILPRYTLYMIAYVTIIMVFGEEYAWRGYVLRKYVRINLKEGLIVTGLAWMLFHSFMIAYSNMFPNRLYALVIHSIVVFSASIPWAWLYLRSRSIIPVGLMHGVFNTLNTVFLGNIYGNFRAESLFDGTVWVINSEGLVGMFVWIFFAIFFYLKIKKDVRQGKIRI